MGELIAVTIGKTNDGMLIAHAFHLSNGIDYYEEMPEKINLDYFGGVGSVLGEQILEESIANNTCLPGKVRFYNGFNALNNNKSFEVSKIGNEEELLPDELKVFMDQFVSATGADAIQREVVGRADR